VAALTARPDALERLARLLPLPVSPVEAPSISDLADVELRLGLPLPMDYKRFIQRYGSGTIDAFLWVLNPSSANESIRLPDSSDRQLGILRWLREQGTESIPHPIYPEPGGLLLWAETANGDCLYWRTVGPPDDWRIAINESRAPNWHDHAGPMTAVLADLLDRTVSVEFFPDSFPLEKHLFAAF
jgi:hypothetical protein